MNTSAILLWTGIEYYSLEHCMVKKSEGIIEISAAIVGKYEDKPYRVNYQLTTDENWNTKIVNLEAIHDTRELSKKLISDGEGNWICNSEPFPEWRGCIDVDLPLTPFTNTLPINRLNLKVGEEKFIKVVYLDVLANEFEAVSQRYKRLSSSVYHYENVPNDFEADITVDEDGFVTDYPGLFRRTRKW